MADTTGGISPEVSSTVQTCAPALLCHYVVQLEFVHVYGQKY